MIELGKNGGTTLLTDICVLSYPHLATKRTNPKYPNSEPKYESVLVFPEFPMSVWECVVAVADRAWPAQQGPQGLVTGEMLIRQGLKKSPLHSGAEKPMDAFLVGKYFINAKSASAIGLVGPDGVTPLSHEAFYAGCFVRAFIGIFPFKDGTGIGVGLNALQFVRDCAPEQRLDNKVNSVAAFAANPLPNQPAPQMPPGGAYAATPAGGAPSWTPPAGQPGQPVYAQPHGQPVHGVPAYPAPAGAPAYPPGQPAYQQPAGAFPPGPR
jgi:hypothetical protein